MGENEEELSDRSEFLSNLTVTGWIPAADGAGRSASESQEEGVAALGAVHGVIFVVEVQDVFLSFETKLLVQQHGGVAGRHVQRHIFPHTCLKTSTAAPVTGDRAPSRSECSETAMGEELDSSAGLKRYRHGRYGLDPKQEKPTASRKPR